MCTECQRCFACPNMFAYRSSCDASELGPLCQEVIEGLEECLSFDLQALKDHAPSVAAEGGAPHSSQPPIPLLLPCDLAMKLASIAILSAHSLRIRGMFAS